MNKRLQFAAAFTLLLALGLYANASNEITGYGVAITTQDSSSVDAFGRWRVSNPVTVFESKQTLDNAPLFWDESLETGAGITSAWSGDTSSTVMTSTVSTAGKFTRQTFERVVYHPGKSHMVIMTGVLDRSGGGTGVQRRIGYFDDGNGIFFEDDEGTVKVAVRSSTSGSPVDTKVAQTAWNVDKMDGTGPSGITVDWTKAQIFCIDFSWLGSGRARLGLIIEGRPRGVHEFLHSNVESAVYMSTPSLPLRYQMITTGSSPASTLEAICVTVASEGGNPEDTGVIRHISTAGTHVDVTTENTLYAIVGIRLKSTHLGTSVDIASVSLSEAVGSKSYEWVLLFNPTVAGTFTYANITNSSLQFATGATANTVTGGTHITGGFEVSGSKGGASGDEVHSTLHLGAAIDGTVDEIVLAVRPIAGSSAIDIEGSITFREH